MERLHGGSAADGTDRMVRGALLVLGLYLVAISVFAAVAPGTFFEEIGPYGARNDHYIHDVAAFQGAVGIFLLLAVRRPAWWVPALAVVTLQFALHAISHLVDIGDADPESLGVAEAIALLVATAGLLWLLVRASRVVRA
jgi:hypothetical protein